MLVLEKKGETKLKDPVEINLLVSEYYIESLLNEYIKTYQQINNHVNITIDNLSSSDQLKNINAGRAIP